MTIQSDIRTRNAQTSKGRVLVVDDEKVNRAVICKYLEREGYETRQAQSGAEAFALMQPKLFDLVMLDIMMPDMDGFEVLQKIRKLHQKLELPVIMVTAETVSQKIVRAFKLGANDYISKPIDPAVTIARVDMHIQFKRSREALQKSEQRYSLVAEGTNDGLWDWNLTTDEMYYSPRWYALMNLDPVDTPDVAMWFDRIHNEDIGRFEKEIRAFESGLTHQLETEVRMRHSDGSYRWAMCRGTAVRDDNGIAVRMAGSLTDITNGKVADALTGLPNRVLFQERLTRCSQKRETEDFDFALLYLDLDNFKSVNDSLGHEAGDRLLVSIARRLEGCLRQTDSFICRIGGDEFVILLEDISSIKEPVAVAKRIISSIDSPIMIGNGREVFASVSVGIASSQDDFEDTATLMQAADTAMYRAKSQGKSCYRVFDPAMKRDANKRLNIENELRRSIERDDFEIHYQPIVSLRTEQLVGFEALVRWHHPTLGYISPAQFIPIAEETGMIKTIGLQVLHKSCSQMAVWRSTDDRFANLKLSVNLSSLQIRQRDFIQSILGILNETGLPAGDLCLEVTESVIMENPKRGAKVLADLREVGIRVAIDDFGTGYSSLSYLYQMSPDSIKIDRRFVDGITASEDKTAIVTAILALCKGMKLDVVAEGIETQKQMATLRDLGCEFAQGYLFSKPIAQAGVPAMLDSFQQTRPVFLPAMPNVDASTALNLNPPTAGN
jgi:diguanylate cyclase (GGDEF)-like protein/PAS domain S-box-containing protein